MGFYYKNITGETKIIAVLSLNKSSVTHMSLAPDARIEVATSLDGYVPHILAKLDADGRDLSYEVVKAREEAKAVVVEKVEEVKPINAPVEVPAPAPVTPTATIEKTPEPVEVKPIVKPGRPRRA